MKAENELEQYRAVLKEKNKVCQILQSLLIFLHEDLRNVQEIEIKLHVYIHVHVLYMHIYLIYISEYTNS